jgi:hypothetical protein
LYKKHLQKVKYLSMTKFYYLPNDNIWGRKIGTLAEGIKPAGNHQAIWDAGGQASGIYFYRIKAGDKVETRKMVVMKYNVQPLTHFRGRYHTALCFWNAIVKLMFPPRSPAIIVLLRVWDPTVKRVLAIYKDC